MVLNHNLAEDIHRSVREVTILFTDIEDSTQFWDQHGDVKGRLLLDQHNRLLMPIMHRYDGRIIKTIGDSLMVSFADPDKAVLAAVAMQQTLHAYRRQHCEHACLKIRIGIHTGMAIVERNDVYGDVVNVASRIENTAKGNQILLSNETMQRLHAPHHLQQQLTFIPRGKQQSVTAFSCLWDEYNTLKSCERLIDFSSAPMDAAERTHLITYSISLAAFCIYFYYALGRYLLADLYSRSTLLTFDTVWLPDFTTVTVLNPHLYLLTFPVIYLAIVIVLMLALLLFLRFRYFPFILRRWLRCGFGFVIGYMLFTGILFLLNLHDARTISSPVLNLDTVFYETIEPDRDNKPVWLKPPAYYPAYTQVGSQQISAVIPVASLLVKVYPDQQRTGVLYAKQQMVWLSKEAVRLLNSTRVDQGRFYLYWLDLLTLFMGLAGSIMGFFSARRRPY